MRFVVDAACEIGQVRERNEDMLLIGGNLVRDRSCSLRIEIEEGERFFLAVADGLGGAAAGEVASETALVRFRDTVASLPGGLDAGGLRAALTNLTLAVHRYLNDEGHLPSRRGMGTTLTGILAYDAEWYVIHIGDTRAYRYSRGVLNGLTTDHTMREVLGRPDIPSNYLANCLGGGAEDVYCDFGGIPGFPEENDALLLTSDGLHDSVSDDDIMAILRRAPLHPAALLVDAAMSVGGRDNISCIYLARNDI